MTVEADGIGSGDVDTRWASLFEVETLAETDLGMNPAALCFKCKCSHGCSTLITDPELIGAQFWSAGVNPVGDRGGVLGTLEQIDGFKSQLRTLSAATGLARRAGDLDQIASSGKIASLIGVSGTSAFDGSAAALRMLAELGVTYVSLTDADVSFADDDLPQLVAQIGVLGMLLHASGTSDENTSKLIELADGPILVSSPAGHRVNGDVLAKVKDKGGLVLAVPGASEAETAEDLGYLLHELGTDGVGLATGDLAADHGTSSDHQAPVFPMVRRALASRKVSDGDIDKVVGGNLARVWEAAERAVRR
ncbi:membrane dipeptidase [Kitasatospora sp. NPDC127116]|uniref:membrane dipeptidase n=1 Tax=Kitasatospora sp. NPDC127116 TaxID=3345367 RepID=UPI0033764387